MAPVTWHEDARLDVDGVPFLVSAIPLTTEAHLIIKSPDLVRRGAADGNLFGAIVEAAADVGPTTLATVEAVDRRPMADLAVAMMMTAATRPGLIGELTVDSEWLTVRRGDDEVSADEFRLGEPWYDAFGYLMADRQETPTEGIERIQPRWPSSRA